MSKRVNRTIARIVAVAVTVSSAALLGVAGEANAEVKSGNYVSTTWSSGIILLQRNAQVRGGDLVLIGRYKIHPTRTGGYVDVMPGHRIILNRDGHGGYRGPAYFNGAVIGSITLTPRR